MPLISAVEVTDVRYPTSRTMTGSDAMNADGDHSAAYVVIRTDSPELSGHGLTFTIGRGTELCVWAATELAKNLIGRDVDAMAADMGSVYRDVSADSRIRWLGPEKGVVHLALAAVMNAAWDLVARRADKPLWKLLVDMTPEQLVDAADMRYVSDALTREDAIAMLEKQVPFRAERIAEMERTGYPAYTTSAGWIGYSDEKLTELVGDALDEGFEHIKLKVGRSVSEDQRRCKLVRELIGPDRYLMVDANQVWDVPVAIDWIAQLQQFDLHWVEEPTSPDDVLGHAAIRKAISPTHVATGEHAHNRIMFKQLLQAGAIDFCQLDSCRLASINEIITVLLLAAEFEVPVCPHAGGVGLCELVQHLSFFDYIAVSGSTEDRVVEYVDHLHEHFVHPVVIENGRYRLPGHAGYSSEMLQSSVDTYEYPSGTFWAEDAASQAAS